VPGGRVCVHATLNLAIRPDSLGQAPAVSTPCARQLDFGGTVIKLVATDPRRLRGLASS
jgi:hypothetical protein